MARRKITRLKPGQPQPVNCEHCKAMHGYQITNHVKGEYTDVYNADGSEDGGTYGDSMRTTFFSKKAHCSNCGSMLRLTVERD